MSYLLLGYRLAYHEFFQFLYILIAVESQAIALSAVAACAACLLVVALNTLRNIIVNHKAYIGLINPHTKGNGSYHYLYFFHKEHVLVLSTGLGIKPCMVGDCGNTIDL